MNPDTIWRVLMYATMMAVILFCLTGMIVGLTLLRRWKDKTEDDKPAKELSEEELADPLRPDTWDADPSDWWKYERKDGKEESP